MGLSWFGRPGKTTGADQPARLACPRLAGQTRLSPVNGAALTSVGEGGVGDDTATHGVDGGAGGGGDVAVARGGLAGGGGGLGGGGTVGGGTVGLGRAGLGARRR